MAAFAITNESKSFSKNFLKRVGILPLMFSKLIFSNWKGKYFGIKLFKFYILLGDEDKILILHNGRLIETGKHIDLISLNKEYSKIFKFNEEFFQSKL